MRPGDHRQGDTGDEGHGTNAKVEIYPGTHHGFAFPKRPVIRDAAGALGTAAGALSPQSLLRGPMPLLTIAFPCSIRSPSRSDRSRSAGMRWPISAARAGWITRARWSRTTAVGRTGADHAAADGRFHSLGHARHHLRRRTAMCCSTICPSSIAHPAEIFELWKGGMSFHGGFLGCVAAVILFCRKHDLPDPVARRYHHRGRADRPVSRAARQFHQQRAIGRPPTQRALGDGIPNGRCRAIRASSTRRGSRECCCSCSRDDSPRRRAATG